MSQIFDWRAFWCVRTVGFAFRVERHDRYLRRTPQRKSSNDMNFNPASVCTCRTQSLWRYGSLETFIARVSESLPRHTNTKYHPKDAVWPQSHKKKKDFMPKVFSFAENIQWHIFKRWKVYTEVGKDHLAVAWWKYSWHCGGFLAKTYGKHKPIFAVVSFHSMYNAATACTALLSCICISMEWCFSASFMMPQLLLGSCSSIPFNFDALTVALIPVWILHAHFQTLLSKA